jgi:hypothetical protein
LRRVVEKPEHDPFITQNPYGHARPTLTIASKGLRFYKRCVTHGDEMVTPPSRKALPKHPELVWVEKRAFPGLGLFRVRMGVQPFGMAHWQLDS